jgi:DnaJ-class molecular chaperone
MQCPKCEGKGIVVTMQDAAFGELIKRGPLCPDCNGAGEIPDPPKPVRFKSRTVEERRLRRPA